MLANVPWVQWLQLGLALIAYIGPGIGILALLNARRNHLTSFYILAFTLSVAWWAVLLAALRWLHIPFFTPPVIAIISLLGWVIGGYHYGYRVRGKPFPFQVNTWEILLIVGVLVSVAINIYAVRAMVVGLGSDSNHHTLITALILWNRSLPETYAPAYPEIITFNYHFGFHGLAAVLSSLSGWEPRLVVLVLAPILIGLSGLGAAYFAYEVYASRAGMLLAGLVPALLAVFPAAMLEWGRYPQTLGLILLPVFFAEYLRVREEPVSRGQLFLISLLAGGLALVHYRVTIMGIMAVVVWEVFSLWKNGRLRMISRQRLIGLATIAGYAILMVAPWFLRVYLNQFVGFSDPYDSPSQSFFSLTRLGETALNYPTNPVLILLAVLCTLWALLKRSRTGIWIGVWTGTLLLSSWLMRGLQYTTADTITVVISLYLPAALILGWAAARLETVLTASRRWVLAAACVLAGGWGAFYMNGLLNVPLAAYVQPADLKAAQWIQVNTPEDACFMINTYRFDFSTNFIIGADAGGWLPLLAGRCVITYPMTSNIERFDHPDGLDAVVELHHLGGQLTDPAALAVMKSHRITHVYIGKDGGIPSMIDPLALQNSPFFEEIYNFKNVYIFKVIYP